MRTEMRHLRWRISHLPFVQFFFHLFVLGIIVGSQIWSAEAYNVKAGWSLNTESRLDALSREVFSYKRVASSPSTTSSENTTFSAYPLLRGTDLLGFGINLRQSTIEDGIKVNLFQWPSNQLSLYTYPLWPNQTYRLPDNVDVRTAAIVDTETDLYNSDSRMSQQLLFNLGISGEFATRAGNAFSGERFRE
jgi:hypothetical protein